MNYIRALVAVAAVSLVGWMGASDASASEVVYGRGARLINVRTGPSFDAPIAYQVAPGTRVEVVCYTRDESGNRWYQLNNGKYIQAFFVFASDYYKFCEGAATIP